MAAPDDPNVHSHRASLRNTSRPSSRRGSRSQRSSIASPTRSERRALSPSPSKVADEHRVEHLPHDWRGPDRAPSPSDHGSEEDRDPPGNAEWTNYEEEQDLTRLLPPSSKPDSRSPSPAWTNNFSRPATPVAADSTAEDSDAAAAAGTEGSEQSTDDDVLEQLTFDDFADVARLYEQSTSMPDADLLHRIIYCTNIKNERPNHVFALGTDTYESSSHVAIAMAVAAKTIGDDAKFSQRECLYAIKCKAVGYIDPLATALFYLDDPESRLSHYLQQLTDECILSAEEADSLFQSDTPSDFEVAALVSLIDPDSECDVVMTEYEADGTPTSARLIREHLNTQPAKVVVLRRCPDGNLQPVFYSRDPSERESTAAKKGYALAPDAFAQDTDPLLTHKDIIPAVHVCNFHSGCLKDDVFYDFLLRTGKLPTTTQESRAHDRSQAKEAAASSEAQVVSFDGVDILLEPLQVTAPEWVEFRDNLAQHQKTKFVRLSTEKEDKPAAMENTYYSPACAMTEYGMLPFMPDPTSPVESAYVVGLSFRLSKIGYAPCLKFAYTFRRQGPKGGTKNHDGVLMFPFGRLHHRDTGQPTSAISNFSCKWVPEDKPYLELKFTSSYALTQNLEPSLSFKKVGGVKKDTGLGLNHQEKSFLEFVRNCREPKDGSHDLVFRLYPYAKEIGKQAASGRPYYQLQELQSYFPGGHAENPMFSKNMWSSYLRDKDAFDPEIQFGMMLSRHAIASTKPQMPIIRHVPPMVFKDSSEYAVMHGYGLDMNYAEEKNRTAAVSVDDHLIGFHKLEGQSSVVIASVKWAQTPRLGLSDNDFVNIPSNTRAVAFVQIPGSAGNTRVEMVSGHSSLEIEGNQVFYLSGKYAEAVLPVAAVFKNGFAKANFFRASLKIEHNSKLAKAKMDIICKVSDPNKPDNVYRKLWPVVNYEGDKHRSHSVDPFSKIAGGAGAKVYQEFCDGPPGKSWHESQYDAVRKAQDTERGFQLVQGIGGSGKTTMLTHKALCLVKAGQNVILMSERNAVCNGHLQNIVKSMKNYPELEKSGFKPLRAFAKQGSLTEIINRGKFEEDAFSDVSPEATAELLHINAQMRSKNRARYEMYQYTIEGHMLEAMDDAAKNDENYENAAVQLIEDGPYLNSYGELRKFLAEVAEHPLNSEQEISVDDSNDNDESPADENAASSVTSTPTTPQDSEKAPMNVAPPKTTRYWTQTRINQVKKVISVCRADVIRSASLIISTVDNLITSSEISQNFAQDPSKVTFVEHDEATQSDEAGTLGVHVKIRANIVSHCLYGDVQQLGRPKFASLLKDKRTGSEEALVNEFYETIQQSLFKRWSNAHFPVSELTTQSRTHEVLFTPAKSFFYPHMDIQGPEYALNEAEKKMMLGINGFDDPLPIQSRFNWAVVNGDVRHDNFGTSRLNFTNIKYIVHILEKWVIPCYGDRTSEMVAVQACYNLEITELNRLLRKLQHERNWTMGHLPVTSTTDNFIGREKHMVIGDVMITRGNRSSWGFMNSNARACVFLTRWQAIGLLVGAKFLQPHELKQLREAKAAEQKATQPASPIPDPPKSTKSRKAPRKDEEGHEMPDNAFIYTHDYLSRKGSRFETGFTIDDLDHPTFVWKPEQLEAAERLILENPYDFPPFSKYYGESITDAQKQSIRDMMAMIAKEKKVAAAKSQG
ncbi:hypothetical protein AC578_2969 [Pseudocercospora eumusae]|uniref:DNA2/NAM7 helicase-like C-terminal domain-containing protein n=1 Tax=Pseudocercospora eumusae TaxID=321146 RepID=A0A139HEJ5_9PEZI|nr:hypothetical protein AC578_2969 [Pseudocercospora eumusae]